MSAVCARAIQASGLVSKGPFYVARILATRSVPMLKESLKAILESKVARAADSAGSRCCDVTYWSSVPRSAPPAEVSWKSYKGVRTRETSSPIGQFVPRMRRRVFLTSTLSLYLSLCYFFSQQFLGCCLELFFFFSFACLSTETRSCLLIFCRIRKIRNEWFCYRLETRFFPALSWYAFSIRVQNGDSNMACAK